MTGDQTWGPKGHLRLEIGGIETSDKVNITGALTLSATAVNPFVIDIHSLNISGISGLVHDFNGYGNFSWKIGSATGGITGFDAAAFSVNTENFANALFGSFSVAQQGQDLILTYTGTSSPAPSFGTWAASLPNDKQGSNDDADGDGISNLVEFATGTSGSIANTDGSPLKIHREVSEGIGHSVLEFSVADPFQPGVTAQLSRSPSMAGGSWQTVASKAGLASWQSLGVLSEGSPSDGRKKVTIRVPDPIGGAPKQFFELRFRNEK